MRYFGNALNCVFKMIIWICICGYGKNIQSIVNVNEYLSQVLANI